MRARLTAATVAVMVLGALAVGHSQRRQRLNPMIDLLEQKKPVFGLYAPTQPRAGGGNRGGGAAAAGGGTAAATPTPSATPVAVPTKTPMDLAKDTLAYAPSDFIFSGSMEGGVDRGIGQFTEYVTALGEAGALIKSPFPHFAHPLAVKTPKIAPDPAKAIDNISRQLNLGVHTIVFVGVESAAEVEQGLKAMRFASKGGTRPETVGTAPALWGMSEAQYKQKADLWPLNPDGELVNWTIVESKEGLAHVREIAAVKGIGALFPGAGTLRGVFAGDAVAWEAAIQQVLDACKEFHVPCGYPANASDIETRMKQGFSVFIMNWGEPGFQAIEIGRRVAGR